MARRGWILARWVDLYVVRGQRWRSTLEGLFDDHGDDWLVDDVASEAGEWLDIVERSRPAWWAEAACRAAPLEITLVSRTPRRSHGIRRRGGVRHLPCAHRLS
jgi:hypothetical protein